MTDASPEIPNIAPRSSEDETRDNQLAKRFSVREIVTAAALLVVMAIAAVLGVSYVTTRNELAKAESSISRLHDAAASDADTVAASKADEVACAKAAIDANASAQKESEAATDYLNGIRNALASSGTTLTDITAGNSAVATGASSLQTAGTEGCKLLHTGN